MNENVNISFIPKKPLAQGGTLKRQRALLTTFFLISFIVAAVAVGVSVMQFFRIEKAEKEKIETIKALGDYNKLLQEKDIIKNIKEKIDFSRQIDIAETLLNKHVASTKLFEFLELTTPKQVSFSNFSFKGSEETLTLSMKGETTSYETLAALSLLYKSNETLKGHTLTNFSITEKGRVSFDFTGELSPSFISYLKEENSN